MGQISNQKLDLVKELYYSKHLCTREIAEKMNVTIDAVIYFMRRMNLRRRSFSEINSIRFQNKESSFKIYRQIPDCLKELKVIGTMLYWSEGYKSGKGCTVDLANSDSKMILMFLRFLREVYRIEETKLRILLYCYGDQNKDELIKFWSKLTKIPKNQFSKPYVRKDFRSDGRKMEHGMIHLRYSDKKLLLEIKKEIANYIDKYK